MSSEEVCLKTEMDEPSVQQSMAPFGSDYTAEPINYQQSPKSESAGDQPPAATAAELSEYDANGLTTGAVGTEEQRPGDMPPGGVTAFQFDASSMTLSIQNSIAAELSELKTELDMIPDHLPYTKRAVEKEIDLLQSGSEPEYLDVDNASQPVRLMRKVLVPVQRNPKFNFVGKLLGPGGKTLQGLIHQTKCRIYVLGRGSSREKSKEDELIASGDPKYSHLRDPLHVRVEVVAPAPIAYQRMAHALNELHYYLQPIRDDIVQSQLAEMASYSQGGGGGGGPRGRGRMGSPGMRGMMRGMPMRGRGMGPRGMGPPVHAQPPPPPSQQAVPSPAAAYGGYQPQQGYSPYAASASSYGAGATSMPPNTMTSPAPSAPTNVPQQPQAMPGTPMPSAGAYPANYNYAYPAYQYGGYGAAGAQGQVPTGGASAAGGKMPPEKRRATGMNAPY